MKSSYYFCTTVLVALISVAPAFADIARPSPSPQKTESRIVHRTGLEIVPDANANEARLQISADTLKHMQAALMDTPASPTLAQTIAHSSAKTIIAGLLLFMSISFGGVWLARSARSKQSFAGRHQKIAAVLLLCMATLGAAAIVTRGNAGPPSYYAWRTLPQSLSAGRPTHGAVDIQIVPEGSGIKLIVPIKSKPNGDE